MVSPLSPALPSLLPPATEKKKCVHLFWLMVVPFSPTPAIKCSRGKQRKEVCTCFDSWSLFSYHPHLHCYQMPQRQKKKERLRVVPFSPTPASLLPNAAEAREKRKGSESSHSHQPFLCCCRLGRGKKREGRYTYLYN